jgi:PAS domain S-box-containing protein
MVTHRVQSQSNGAAPAATHPSATLMFAALAQLDEGVIVADADGRITFVNEAAARLHGMARLDVTPEHYAASYQLLTEDGAPYPSTELPLARAVLRGETVIDARWRIRRPDGSEISAVGSARPVLAPGGEQLGAVLTVRDDTLRIRAEQVARSASAMLNAVSDERARATGILEQMADAHFVLDAEYRFVSVNAASERTLRRRREELIGRCIWDVFPKAVGGAFDDAYRTVMNDRVEVHLVNAYTDDELDIVAEVDAYPTVDGGVAVFWRDIGPRVRAEEGLRASEKRLRELFEQAPVAVAVMSGPDHIYTTVSPLYARTPGLGRPLIGRSMREAFPEVAATGYIEAMDRVYRTGIPFAATERQVMLARPGDGALEEHFFNIGFQPLRDSQGRVYAVASVAYDVTDHVRARREADLARVDADRQRHAAQAANMAKSEFLSTVSHELRTPLHAIAGYTELLTMGLRGPLSEPQRHDLERIRQASEHLLGLVTDVLNFARVEAGHVEYNLVEVEFATLLAELAPLVMPLLEAKQLTFDRDGCADDTPDQPHRVYTDPEKLRQILLNLLSNAIKFTDVGGRVSISCHSSEDDPLTRVDVRDTGRGIPADQTERIFEPFVQVDRHRTPGSQQGVGLGLSISRDLARAMGGDLTVTSVVGEGSTFSLTLPRAPQP